MIGFEPDDEQQLVIDTVHQFAENEIRPVARECEEARTLPEAVLESAHELGLVANALPEAAGGGGARSAVTGALIAEELAWGDLAIALAVLSPALTALPVAEFGSEDQRQDLGRFSAAGFVPGALAWAEPSFDFDPMRPRSTATLEDGVYSLRGEKCLVPWLPSLEQVLVVATIEGEAALFRVPAAAPGLAVETERNMGIGALPTATLRFDGVRLSEGERIAESDLRRLLAQGRVALGAMAVGVARAAFEVARDYAKEREAFGAPIATKQAIAFELAQMAIEIDGARLLVWEAAWQLDQGVDAGRAARLAREQCARVSLEVADSAVQVLGGHGYIRDYLPELHLRNARGFAAFEALALV